ncbi:HAD family hydrolase [Eionea flava]
MTLIVFDLDGTLLNKHSAISDFTKQMLQKLHHNNIAFTVATGRTFNSAQTIIAGHPFVLPQIYSNGVIIWDPNDNTLLLDNCLAHEDAHFILNTTLLQKITPFISAVNADHQHFIFHPDTIHDAEKNLLRLFQSRDNLTVLPLKQMPADMAITNISMIGDASEIDHIHHQVNTQTHLIAYSGPAIEGNGLKWMDIHHNNANKGNGISQLRKRLKTEKIICFGDSDNDLSMFAQSDESYATANAKQDIQDAANDVIGHHHEDGVAHYLTKRFNL